MLQLRNCRKMMVVEVLVAAAVREGGWTESRMDPELLLHAASDRPPLMYHPLFRPLYFFVYQICGFFPFFFF